MRSRIGIGGGRRRWSSGTREDEETDTLDDGHGGQRQKRSVVCFRVVTEVLGGTPGGRRGSGSRSADGNEGGSVGLLRQLRALSVNLRGVTLSAIGL